MQPVASMTGFARIDGEAEGLGFAWELRSVNNRGLDLRLRLPAGFEGLEPQLRRWTTGKGGRVVVGAGHGTALTQLAWSRDRSALTPVST